MLTEKDLNEFLQWQQDTGRMRNELTDIAINDNGNIKFKKRMAWVSHTTPKDWMDFCEATGREFEGVAQLFTYIK